MLCVKRTIGLLNVCFATASRSDVNNIGNNSFFIEAFVSVLWHLIVTDVVWDWCPIPTVTALPCPYLFR